MCLTIGRLIRITVDERLVGHKVLMILAESSKVIMSLIIVTVVSLTSVTLIKLITVKDGQVVPPSDQPDKTFMGDFTKRILIVHPPKNDRMGCDKLSNLLLVTSLDSFLQPQTKA